MAYTVTDYKSKKSVREDLKAGKTVRVYQPGPFGPDVPDGPVALEGPHYPKPHSWYASGMVKDGKLVSVR
jgi:hypothetical protein